MNNKRQYSQLMIDYMEHERRARENAITESQQIIRHYVTPGVGVVLPFMQSAITAILASILVTVGAVHWWAWSWYKTFLISFLVVMLADWLRRCGAWSNSVKRLEGILQADINNDGWIGPEPEQMPVEPFRVEVHENESGRHTWSAFPVGQDAMMQFADGLCQGMNLSVSTWSGAGALFSRNQYEQVIAELMRRDLAEWRDPNSHQQGVMLNTRGWAVMRSLAASRRGVHPSELPTPPSA